MDVFTKSKRSEVMSRVRGRGNKETEGVLIKLFRKDRITGWRRHLRVFGNPDFIFQKSKLAVFVDGCFWHGCSKHCTYPATNQYFWSRKLESNVTRDQLVNRELRKRGWCVLRIWEHQLRDVKRVAGRLQYAQSIENRGRC